MPALVAKHHRRARVVALEGPRARTRAGFVATARTADRNAADQRSCDDAGEHRHDPHQPLHGQDGHGMNAILTVG